MNNKYKNMAKIVKKIVLNEKDIKELVAEKYGLDVDTATIYIDHYKGDFRESGYTNITIEGVEKK
jgi:hypothetical protein